MYHLYSKCLNGKAACTRMVSRCFLLLSITYIICIQATISLLNGFVDGESYPSGSTFPAPDGCNTW